MDLSLETITLSALSFARIRFPHLLTKTTCVEAKQVYPENRERVHKQAERLLYDLPSKMRKSHGISAEDSNLVIFLTEDGTLIT